MKAKATEKLCSLLTDGIDVHRCAAARALEVMDAPQATAVLVQALLDEDPDVRVDAATSLAAIGDAATAEKLMENLVGDPEADVKKAAITALVDMKYQPIVPLLRALAVTRSEDKVVWDEDEFYSDGWDSWVDIQIAAIKGLAVFAPEEDAVDEILEALSDEMGQDVSEPAYHALAQMGKDGARALETIFEAGDARLCRRIARVVGRAENPHLKDLRSAILADASPALRALAVQSIAPSDSRLIPLLADADSTVRASVVRHAGAANLDQLHEMIADTAPAVRSEIFKIIAAHPDEFRNKTDIEAVRKTLRGDPAAAKQAALALFALEGPKIAKGFFHVLGKKDIPREFRLGVLETLEKAGQIAVPALLGIAGNPDRQLRLAGLTVLANIAATDAHWPNDAGDGLLLALKGELVLPPEEDPDEIEPEPEVDAEPEPEQAELDEITKEIDESLPLVVDDVAPGSTLHAIMANEPAQPDKEPQEIVLDAAQERLLALTNTRKFAKRKVSWQTDVAPYLDVQRFSARLLGQVAQPDVAAALTVALQSDSDEETRQAVLFSLASLGENGVALPTELRGHVEVLLASSNSETRVLATRVLGWLPDDDVVSELERLLGHEDQLLRVEAIQALEHRNIAGEAVISALKDEYVGVGIAAARSLARLSGEEAVNDLIEFAVRNDGIYRAEIGKLLGQYAPYSGASRLIDLLNDESRKSQWLVAIDALAEIFQKPAHEGTRLVA